jgi:uncharacterized membrane protein HdeD (DUF308 family)
MQTSTSGSTVLFGVLIVFAGILCMVLPMISGQASVVLLGALLAGSGLLEVVAAARGQRERHWGVWLSGGLLSLAAGGVMIASPGAGMRVFTLLLAALFLGAGLVSVVTSLLDRSAVHAGRGAELAFGFTALALGATTLLWPASKLWLLGTLIGIAIVVRGATMIVSAERPRSVVA